MFHSKSLPPRRKTNNFETFFNCRACNPGCINSSLVKGKIVMCSKFEGYTEVHKVGAAGSILFNDQYEKVSFVVSLPAVAVSMENFNSLISYKNSTKY